MTEVRFRIDVPIRPEWRNVELLRTSILSCLAAVFQSDDLCHTVSMVAGELIENAIKFGDWQSNRAWFRLNVCGDDDALTVEVSNPYGDGTAIEDVRAVIDRLNAFPSAKEAYTARLREVADMPMGADESRLGLLRIAYEGGCAIEAIEDPHQVLRIKASTSPALAGMR